MTNPLLNKHVDELRETWQAHALRASEGKLQRIIIAVLAKEYHAAFPILWRVVFPSLADIPSPVILSYASVLPNGKLIAEMGDKSGKREWVALYRSQDDYIADTRKLADKLKLDDSKRIEMFRVLARWVTSDKRVDHEGRKLAS